MTTIIGWFKALLRNFYMMDTPVVRRSKTDRRRSQRRWEGPEGDKPKAFSDPRRRKERRKAARRG